MQPTRKIISSSSTTTKKQKCISLLNSSNSHRIDAKETAVVVAETEKEETVGDTSLRFSADVVGSSSSTQQQQQHLDQKVKMNTYEAIHPTHHDIVKQYRKGLTAVVDRCVYIYPTIGTTLSRIVSFVAALVETLAC